MDTINTSLITELCGKLVRAHGLVVESLTEKQLAECIRQAIEAGDFMRHVIVDQRVNKQCVTYLPFQECDRIRTLYNELILAVSMKHDGETRHETALRYIRERESDNHPTEEKHGRTKTESTTFAV